MINLSPEWVSVLSVKFYDRSLCLCVSSKSKFPYFKEGISWEGKEIIAVHKTKYFLRWIAFLHELVSVSIFCINPSSVLNFWILSLPGINWECSAPEKSSSLKLAPLNLADDESLTRFYRILERRCGVFKALFHFCFHVTQHIEHQIPYNVFVPPALNIKGSCETSHRSRYHQDYIYIRIIICLTEQISAA